MSNRKLARAVQQLFREIWKLYKVVTKRLVNWLMRAVFVTHRKTRFGASGFVLPTTLLLILVVVLTVTAITYRAFNRNTQSIGQNQQRIIYNAATPAIDRARSKLEFLFDPTRDTRYPGGVPSENRMLSMLLNDGSNSTAQLLISGQDPYTFPDERRLNLGVRPGTGASADRGPDNAWSYRADTNGDGTPDATVIYSIVMSTPAATGGQSSQQVLIQTSDQQKANQQLVRHGPLSNEARTTGCSFQTASQAAASAEQGWFEDTGNTSVLRKNFQVDAYVVPDRPGATRVTLEFHQDRQLNRGNKWGAWFRNDLEIFPGPQFNWNGAMHTEGNLIIGNSSFTAYLVSSPASCLYAPESSEITVTNVADGTTANSRDFQGQAFAGRMNDNSNGGGSRIYVHNANPVGNFFELNSGTDSTNDTAPLSVSIDPVTVLTTDNYRNRAGGNNRTSSTWAAFRTSNIGTRIINQAQAKPYVDDLYRADDRWGPKPRYDDQNSISQAAAADSSIVIGSPIVGNATLTAQDPPTGGAAAQVGLDGYWERRARNEGLRILVGQRLELGNPFGWVTPRDANNNGVIDPPPQTPTPSRVLADVNGTVDREGDPLYPPYQNPISHLDRHRRTLRDNLAAVQAAGIYHAAVGNNPPPDPANPTTPPLQDRDYPIACLASTAHPGTLTTLRQSINYVPTVFRNGTSTTANIAMVNNFFLGRGTNGWEFTPPAGTHAAFETAMNDSGSRLRTALSNLANFSGDPNGAYPPVQSGIFPPGNSAPSNIFPDPELTMWGNFSNLRRTLTRLNSTAYRSLSIADKTYLQTAACTVGMLAYNIDAIQQYDRTNSANDSTGIIGQLADDIGTLMDGVIDNVNTTTPNLEVLPSEEMSTYNYRPNITGAAATWTGAYRESDYWNVPSEAFLGKLRELYLRRGVSLSDPRYRMAEVIFLSHQIRRDRTYGFRSSPYWGNYFVVLNNAVRGFPAACDPDEFSTTDRPPVVEAFPGSTTTIGGTANSGAPLVGSVDSVDRLRLSRLCGSLNIPSGWTINANAPYFAGTNQPTVLPKFPSLYYLFPEFNHDHDGAVDTFTVGGVNITVDHRQPGETSLVATPPAGYNPRDREPYITDGYIRNTANTGVTYQVVDTTLAAVPRAANPSPSFTLNAQNPVRPPASGTPIDYSRYPAGPTNRPYPVQDRSVASVAVLPRRLPGASFPNATAETWQLPIADPPTNIANAAISGGPNISPNIIVAPNNTVVPTTVASTQVGRTIAIPFLDRVIFNGRELMSTRVMDIDLGMLRSRQPGNQQAGNTQFSPSDVWLPVSGIVYAFREDAVREDGIARPPGTGMDARNPNAQTDPTITVDAVNRGISTKPVDYMPDPDRRPHGFRLRNGSQLKRNTAFESPGGPLRPVDNIRGLSFFTDQPVYIMGDFNLHQTGADDTAGTRLEEFTQLLPTAAYTEAQFYTNRTTRDTRFAQYDQDRWRPSEILADAISVVSNNLCDGSAADSFVYPATPAAGNPIDFTLLTTAQVDNPSSPRSQYHGPTDANNGLYGPGCTNNGYTTFHNQTRPNAVLPTAAFSVGATASGTVSTTWVRENPADFTSPIKIGRNADPLVRGTYPSYPASGADSVPAANRSLIPIDYNLGYFALGSGTGNRRDGAATTRINSIVVSGIVPSRQDQAYGGLHNFPRFLEAWPTLFFSGSFLQLNFSNYASAPFDQEAFEPGTTPSSNENIPYYSPPTRLWGYDVALQYSPAGPAASRFVTASRTRTEFYDEPAANDPFIRNLCNGLRNNSGVLSGAGYPNFTNLNCPS